MEANMKHIEKINTDIRKVTKSNMPPELLAYIEQAPKRKLKTSELGIVIGEVLTLESGQAAIWIKKQGTSEYELVILEKFMYQVLQLVNAA